jgi:hypothetical protein
VAVLGADREAEHVARSLAAAWSAAGIVTALRGTHAFHRKATYSLRRKQSVPRVVQRVIDVRSARAADDADLVVRIADDSAGQDLVVSLDPVFPAEAPESFRVPPPEMANYEAFTQAGDAALPLQDWLPLLLAMEPRLRS